MIGGPMRKGFSPAMAMGLLSDPEAAQPGVEEESPWYGSRDQAAMMMAALSNGLAGLTLRGKSAMAPINNATFAGARKNIKRNQSMDFLAEKNPELHKQLMQLPEEVRDLYMGEAFKAMFAEPKDSYSILTPEQKEKLGLPAEGNFKINTATGEVSGIGNGGTTINNNIPGSLPTPKAGYRNVTNDDGQLIAQEVIPGGPADLEAQETAARKAHRQEQKADAGMTVVQDLQRALDLAENGNAFVQLPAWAGGETALGEVVEGEMTKFWANRSRTDANAAMGFAKSAKANIGLDQLQTMRETSPTGGALGQVPVQQQEKLESLLGSLDNTTMRPEDFKINAERAVNIYLDLVMGNAQERASLVERGILDPEANREIENMYKPLPFGRNGELFPVENPPPDWDLDPRIYFDMDDEKKLRTWNFWETERYPAFYNWGEK